MPLAQGERFPKSLRLRRRADFVRVQAQGKRAATGPLLALALPNGTRVTRAGFTVSGKVGNAVVRARIRRRLRELFRKRRQLLPQGVDVVFIARASAKQADHRALAAAFEELAAKLGRAWP